VHGRRQTALVAAAAAGGLALASMVPVGAAVAANPNNSKKMTKAITQEALAAHLEAFQGIADANGGNRASGNPGYEASAQYVEQRLQAAGYETERQYFEFTYEETLAETLTAGGQEFDPIVMSYSPNTPEGGVTGTLAAPATATGCTAAEWGGVDATGQIAVVSRGVCPFSDKVLAAADAGAEGVVVYNIEPGPVNGTLGEANPAFVPAAGVSPEEGAALLELVGTGTEATLVLEQISELRETFNVIAETATGRDDNVVMLGAHLDSTPEGAGINDNATGSAALLETAIQLAKVNKLNNTVRFAWWGAEERGLVGAWEYVEGLSQAERDRIATYLNFDMVGSPNYVIGVYDADESTYTAPVDVPEGSIESEAVFTDYFDSIGQPWVDVEFSGRSDYQPFILNGIPASGLFTGGDGVKTEEEAAVFGGTAGITYDPNYHTPADTIDNVDMDAMTIMSKAIAHSAITLAQDTSAINGKRSAGKSGKPHPQEGAHPHEHAEDAA